MAHKFSNFQGFVWCVTKRDWVGRVVYPIQILLLLRYTAENVIFANFNMLFQFLLTNFFKGRLFSCFRKLIT